MNTLKIDARAVVVLVLMAAVYAAMSIGNHLMFRTYGLDLGIYTQALYGYAHLHGNDCTFFLWQPAPLLADHFDLYLVLLSPLVYLFGSYTLLVVQIVAVLLGMLGMYRLARLHSDNGWLPIAAMLMLGLGFGVWHAVGYDYHSNVLAAMLLPWLVASVERRRVWPTVIVAVAMILAKETSALWVVAVLVALMFDCRGDRRMLATLALTAAGCLAYFLAVTLWVMPSLGGGSGRGFWRYSWMGASVGEVARWVLTHPWQALKDLFTDFTPEGGNGRLKAEFFACALLSGGLLTLLKPNYLLMLVPPVVMKMLAADTGFWGVCYHYNVEVSAVLAVGAVVVLGRLRGRKAQGWAGAIALGLTLLTLIYTTGNPYSPIRKDNVRILDARHYRQPDFDVDEARRLVRQVPPDASVCATTMFTPHLATRDSAYLFPLGLGYGAEWYLLLRRSPYYYEGEEEQVDRLIADTAHYRIVDTDGQLYLLRRRGGIRN